MNYLQAIRDEQTRIFIRLENLHPSDEEYVSSLRTLTELVRLQAEYSKEEKPSKLKQFLENEVLLAGVLNLTAILLVINHERLNVITSKAFVMIPRFR